MNTRELKEALTRISAVPYLDETLIEIIFTDYARNKLGYWVGQLSADHDKALEELRVLLLEMAEFYNLHPQLNYNFSPRSYINQAAFLVAMYLEPIIGINRYQLIMPELKVLSSVITLTDITTEDVPFHSFFQTRDRFIEIVPCLQTAINDGVLKHTSLIDHQVMGLDEMERRMVTEHSVYTQSYWRAIQRKVKIEKEGFSFGAALSRLAEGLANGSVGSLGPSVNMLTGLAANNAIIEFSEWLLTLTKTEYDNLMVCHSSYREITMEEIWGRLSDPFNKKYKKLVQCTDILSADVKGILEENSDLFQSYPASLWANIGEYDLVELGNFFDAQEEVRVSESRLQQAMEESYQVTYRFPLDIERRNQFILKLFSNPEIKKFVTPNLVRLLLADADLCKNVQTILTEKSLGSVWQDLIEWVSLPEEKVKKVKESELSYHGVFGSLGRHDGAIKHQSRKRQRLEEPEERVIADRPTKRSRYD